MKSIAIVLFVLACVVVLGGCGDDETTLATPQQSACSDPTVLEGSQQNATGSPLGFFSIQLRRISDDEYEIHVSDHTADTDAYGLIVVIDLGTNVVIINKRFPAASGPGYGDFDNPGTFDEALTITADRFRVSLEALEHSGSSLFFGDDAVSHWHPPTDQMISESRDYCAP